MAVYIYMIPILICLSFFRSIFKISSNEIKLLKLHADLADLTCLAAIDYPNIETLEICSVIIIDFH